MPDPTDVGLREVASARVLNPPEDFGAAAGASLARAVSQALESSPALLVVDFSGVGNVNSAGVGALFDLVRRAREQGVTAVFAALSAQPRLVIERVRLPLYVPVYSTVDEAISSHSQPGG